MIGHHDEAIKIVRAALIVEDCITNDLCENGLFQQACSMAFVERMMKDAVGKLFELASFVGRKRRQ